MRIKIAKDREGLGNFAGSLAAQLLREALDRKPRARLVVATGSSQFEILSTLAAAKGIDWGRVDGFHLDEYIGIDRSHAASFCGYLAKRFVDRVPIGSFYFLDGSQPPELVVQRAGVALTASPIDLALVGIGENGHLAFNDPPADFQTKSPYLIVNLDEACRKQQVGEGWFDRIDQVPEQAISMSISAIMSARSIICGVPDKRKSSAVVASIEGPVTPLMPASVLQQHPNTTVVLDFESASQLSMELIQAAENV